MSKLSAGIIAYKQDTDRKVSVLLVHPGGPYWKNKDEGTWSIPKGEYEEGEDALAAAKREFEEETGNIPEHPFLALKPIKLKSGKIISAWAIEADFEKPLIQSNYFEMEWPPKSGKKQSFPEVDKAEWFTLEEARRKINPGQINLLEQLQLIIL